MNWTRKKPKIDGYYWMKRKGKTPNIIKIWDAPNDSTVSFCGSDWDQPIKKFKNAEWYGPLKPPEEDREVER